MTKNDNDNDSEIEETSETTESAHDTAEESAQAQEPADAKSAPSDRETEGPFDESEVNPARPYVDLGAIKVLPREGLHLRLEIEDTSKQVVAVGLDFGRSTLQVQPFAAPRSSGLWHEIRQQVAEQIQQQGGTVTEGEGPFGPELRAQLPVASADGSEAVQRVARFVGVDGPRWFLRGVIAGEAAEKPETAGDIEDLFRSLVVVRGDAPMPPRDLLPLQVPASPPEQPTPTPSDDDTEQ